MFRHWTIVHTIVFVACVATRGSLAGEACRIEVVDKESGWPVPLVELRTVSGIRLVTDNAGVIACDEPEVLGRETWFQVVGQGYGVPPDGFGMEGIRLTPRAGETIRVEVERRVIARRLGRITGSGLFAESAKLGDSIGLQESGIVGCDSVQSAVYRGKMYWVWGDTTLPGYPLGIFHASGATSDVNPLAASEPPLKLSLKYFTDARGRPRGVARVSGDGPTWLTALTTIEDAQGTPHLVAMYMKIEPPLSVWQQGLCEWSDTSEQFEVKHVLWKKGRDAGSSPKYPQGHTVGWTDEQGQEWILIGNPFPSLKIPASYAAWNDPSKWVAVEPTGALRSVKGESVKVHSGHIAWSKFRQRWVTVFVEAFGSPSGLGEVWYAESKSPLGPWGPAVKILSHRNYTFYNPRIHPAFVEDDAPYVFFEGTYTTLFAGPSNTEALAPEYPQPTPRYDYNQILYRLDLEDPRLKGAWQ